MNPLDLNYVEESMSKFLEIFPEELGILDLEEKFYVQWRELGCFLFERLCQK